MASRRPPDESSEEGEPTALDIGARVASLAPKPGAAKHRRPSPVAVASRPPLADHVSEGPTDRRDSASRSVEEDEDATEFLAVRPSSVLSHAQPSASGSSQRAPGAERDASAPSLRARGRAVPLEARDDAPPSAAPPRVPPPRHQRIVDNDELEPTDPPAPLSQKIAAARELASAPSQPRITRIPMGGTAKRTLSDDQGASETDPGDDEPSSEEQPPPPRHRPLPPRADARAAREKPATMVTTAPEAPLPPNPFKRENTRSKSRPDTQKNPDISTTGVHTAESEAADGTLVVEVPEGASVFVDGAERGRGPQVRISQIDRYAKHAVRIHASGFLPWSGSVSLDGRMAAKIRPTLRKRGS